ncbi:MAG: glycosyltransferase [Planctomycetes bacterium]|nr:glycosyltransferase [Planctomycetota bacterium]
MRFDLPPIWLVTLWALWVCQAVWCWWNVGRFRRRLAQQVGRAPHRKRHRDLPAVIIVPVKGVDDHFAEHVRGLMHQGYFDYRLLFVTQSADEPAHVALADLIAGAPRAEGLQGVDLITAGVAQRGGQKVHNQLAALRTLDDTEAVIVFADADAVPDDDWLESMVIAAQKERMGAATGYRWFIPADDAFASRLASVLNSSAATMLGPAYRNHAWGGAMAIKRSLMTECKLVEHFDGALSDDYQLTRAVRSIGRRVYFMSRGMAASPAKFTWARLIEFARRQYRITRIYAPWTWLGVLAILSLYLAGWVSAIAGLFAGMGDALVAIALVMTFDIARGFERRRVVRALFGDETARRLAGALRLDIFSTPLWMALHWLIVLSTALGRRITWAGIRYHMRGRRDVRIEGRDEPARPG